MSAAALIDSVGFAQCKKKVPARKCMKLLDCPPVLTLQFKRFAWNGTKIGKPLKCVSVFCVFALVRLSHVFGACV